MHLVLTTLGGHDPSGAAAAPDGWEMTAAHAVATLLTALVLARADAMLLAVLRVVRVILPLLVRPLPVPVAASGVVRARPERAVPLLSVELRRVRGRRGPPGGS